MNTINKEIKEKMDMSFIQQASSNLFRRLLFCLVEEKLKPEDVHFEVTYLINDSIHTLKDSDSNFTDLYYLKHFFIKAVQVTSKSFTQIYNDPLSLLKDYQVHIKECLQEDFSEQKWINFLSEIENCYQNDILTCEALQQKKIDFQNNLGNKKFLDWIFEQDPNNLLLFLEQYASEGHPFHPGYKTKTGWTEEEVKAYSPEFSPEFELEISALHKDQANSFSLYDNFNYNEWFQQQFPEVFKVWEDSLIAKKLNSNDFFPIPIHPWQEEFILSKELIDLKQTNLINTNARIQVSPSLSLRSFHTKQKIQIKVPLSVRLTSGIRHISPSRMFNSIPFSKAIREILAKEKNFNETIDFLDEEIILHCDEGSIINYDQAKHISCLFRKDPSSYLRDNERMISLASLFSTYPSESYPIIIHLLDQFSNNNPNQLKEILSNYISLVLEGHLELFIKYGISLESHQQNTLLVMNKEGFKRILARDTGGIKINESIFKQEFPHISLHKKSNQSFKTEEPIYQLIHALLNSHLIPLIEYVSYWKQISKEDLFKQVLLVISSILEKHSCSSYGNIIKQIDHIMLCSDWKMKALFRMRIVNKEFLDLFTFKRNPLL
jgi:siderophore synthetase component